MPARFYFAVLAGFPDGLAVAPDMVLTRSGGHFMASRALISLSLCLAAAFRLAGATVQPDKINGLLNNSPFGQSRTGATAGSGTNDPLEFRAVLEDKGGMMFSIYDTAAHRSIWVQLKDSANGFAVNEYDAARESVTVDFHGRSLILPIKRAPAVAQTPRPNAPGALGGGPSSNQAGQAGLTPVDQQRMQQIQEEIRRRRALREQPSANASPAGAQGGPQFVPYNSSSGSQTGPVPTPANNSTGSQAGPQLMPSNSPGPQPGPSNSPPPPPSPPKP
jgi:hypothetical protein